MILYIDVETFNAKTDISQGVFRYAETAEVDLFGYAIDDAETKIWDRTVNPDMPQDLADALLEAEEVWFHHAMFDDTILRIVMGINIPYEKIRCSMALALSLGLPGGLEQLGQAIGLAEDQAKLRHGKKLVLKFCRLAPTHHKLRRYDRHNSPQQWEEYKDYGKRDVETMRIIIKKLPRWNYTGQQLALYHLDQKINARGFNLDRPLAEAAIRAISEEREKLMLELIEITGLMNPNSNPQFLQWLQGRGVEVDNVQAATLKTLQPKTALKIQRALQLKMSIAKTPTTKFKSMLNKISTDGRMRGTLRFCGASRTGRWSSTGVNFQNLYRPTIDNLAIEQGIEALKAGVADLVVDDVMELAASSLRGVLIAPEGKKLVVSDLSSIEAVVLPWLAGEQWVLDAFARGEDLYKATYSKSFGVPLERVTKAQRSIGKVELLACGFGGSTGAFSKMAEIYGLSMPEDEMLRVVKAWRKANPRIVDFWYKLEDAAKTCIRTPGLRLTVGRIKVTATKQWLLFKLPSGRLLTYYQPRIDEEGVSYMGTNSFTRKWERISTWGGKSAENMTQAVARDIMAAALPNIEKAGYKNILLVHDESVTETPDSPEFSAKGLSAILATPPPWAKDLPLAAAGFESKRYRKE